MPQQVYAPPPPPPSFFVSGSGFAHNVSANSTFHAQTPSDPNATDTINPSVSAGSRTAGAALAMALRAAASAALSKTLSAATSAAPTPRTSSPDPPPAGEESVLPVPVVSGPAASGATMHSSSGTDAHTSLDEAPGPVSGAAKGAVRKYVSKALVTAQPLHLRGKPLRPARDGSDSRRRSPPRRAVAAAAGHDRSESPARAPQRRGGVDAETANSLIVNAVAARYEAEGARAELQAEVVRLRSLLQQRSQQSGSLRSPVRKDSRSPEHALSVVSFIAPSGNLSTTDALGRTTEQQQQANDVRNTEQAELGLPSRSDMLQHAALPPSHSGLLAPNAPFSDQPRARAARLRATAAVLTGVLPARVAADEFHRLQAADDSTPALAPGSDTLLPVTLREALAAAAVFRPSAALTRGPHGQRRWPAEAAPSPYTLQSRTQRGIAYPLPPDSAEFFEDIPAAEAQATADGLHAFVPLRLVTLIRSEMEVQVRQRQRAHLQETRFLLLVACRNGSWQRLIKIMHASEKRQSLQQVHVLVGSRRLQPRWAHFCRQALLLQMRTLLPVAEGIASPLLLICVVSLPQPRKSNDCRLSLLK
jgi:hypothetical protein